MSEQSIIVLGAVVAIFGVIAVGAVLRRLEWLTEDADRSLLLLTIRVLVPALTLHVIVGNDRLREPINVWLPPALGFASAVLGYAAAFGAARLSGTLPGLRTRVERRTFAFCAGLQNYGYIPLPLAAALFDTSTVGVVFVFMVGVDIGMWTVGVAVITGGLTPGWWKRVVNAPSVAIVAALLLNLIDWQHALPHDLYRFAGMAAGGVGMLGACAIPVALLLIGATVADEFRAMDPRRAVPVMLVSTLVRNGVLPLAILAAVSLPGLSIELRRVIVLQAAMPAAVMPIVLARHYGGDPPAALRTVLGSSLAGLITIPLWLSLGLALLGEAPTSLGPMLPQP